MTLNRNHHPNGGVLIQAGESILRECKNVELSFSDVTPKNDLFKGTKKGSVYLTQYRMVFVSSTMKEKFCSLMFPYYLMKNCSIEQPVFAANYIQGLIKAEAGGGWEGQANFKMSFPSGGAIELGQHLFKLATNASRAPPAQNGAFGLAAGMNGYASPAMPQPYPYPYPSMPQAGYSPYPQPPAAGTVRLAELKNHTHVSAPGNAKAAEAASSAFYNPSNPHSVYMPMVRHTLSHT
uniref:WW domain-binding protein 2-like n=1 Tax=Sinocyclocheilus anshuiensis TaxID=1608454 RepID=A0A671Q640_9TELE